MKRETVIDMQTEQEAGRVTRNRGQAIGICIVMFIAFLGLDRAISSLLTPFALGIAMPAGATPAWWHVAQKLAAVALSDVLAALIPVSVYLWATGRRLRDLGFNRPGTPWSWIPVLAVEALLLWVDVTKGPVGRAPNPLNVYALAGSAFAGLGAPLAEETFFRGFLMNELERGGFGLPIQIAASAVLFGGAHYAYGDWGTAIMTGAVGGFWAFIYVFGKRSLWPILIAHFINDAVVIPSAFYLIASHATR